MDRKTTIEYMRKAVACNKADYSVCANKRCSDCQYDYPVQIIELVESALKLIEEETDGE